MSQVFGQSQLIPIYDERVENELLPDNQKILLHQRVLRVNPADGSRVIEENRGRQAYCCQNPYGLHGFQIVYVGDGCIVDEEGRAWCRRCIEKRQSDLRRKSHQLLPDLEKLLRSEETFPSLSIPPDPFDDALLPPLEPEEPPTRGWIVPYSLEEEWKLNPPPNLVAEQMPEIYPPENDRSPIVMTEDDTRRMMERINQDIQSGKLRIW